MSLQYLIEIAIQIGFCFHAVRTGRTQWMFIILFIPFIGWLAYLVIEILPSIFTGHKAQILKGNVKRSLNPHKDLKDARYAFEMTPTVSNRITYGRELMERRQYDEAIAVLKPGLTNFFAGDPALLEGLAFAYYEKGSDAEALPYVEQILKSEDWPVLNPRLSFCALGSTIIWAKKVRLKRFMRVLPVHPLAKKQKSHMHSS